MRFNAQTGIWFSDPKNELNEVYNILITAHHLSGQGEHRPAHKDITLNISGANHR